MKKYAKKVCQVCHRKIRKLYFYKDKALCWRCYRHNFTHIPGYATGFSLEKALGKVYTIKSYVSKHGRIVSMLSFPQVLAGKRIRISLVDEK